VGLKVACRRVLYEEIDAVDASIASGQEAIFILLLPSYSHAQLRCST
jgi:hypothetical protein